MSVISIKSPAKINLYLKVLGKRKDGYHEIESVILPINIYDKIILSKRAVGLDFFCDHNELQDAENNLAYQAAQMLADFTGRQLPVSIKLYKKIPIAAGLGGGSSNAASVLLGLNQLYNLGVSRNKLLGIGAQLGADIPFFILSHPAIATGKGEKLTPINFNPTWLVVINPGFPVKTAQTYASINLGLTKAWGYNKMPAVPVDDADVGKLADLLKNDLEPPVIKQYPLIDEIKKRLLAKGAEGALMSGSGPSVFGLFSSSNKAYTAYKKLKEEAAGGWSVFFVHTLKIKSINTVN